MGFKGLGLLKCRICQVQGLKALGGPGLISGFRRSGTPDEGLHAGTFVIGECRQGETLIAIARGCSSEQVIVLYYYYYIPQLIAP